MKYRKTIFHALLIFLLLLSGSFVFPVRAEKTERPFRLTILNLEIHVDEATDRVETSFIVENPNSFEAETILYLPLISTGCKAGSLRWESLFPGSLSEGQDLQFSCNIPAGKAQMIRYTYQSASPLIHARVIGLDLDSLRQPDSFRETPIGRLHFSLTLREEDIPLVREVSPYNWEFAGNSLQWSFYELYDPGPDPLLTHLYVEKETYRNLRGSREYEPNEVQQYVLDHCAEWFREGIPLPKIPDSISEIFYGMLYPGCDPGENQNDWWSNYYELLPRNNTVFTNLVIHLILREVWAERIPKAYEYTISSQIQLGLLGPLTRDILRRQLYGDELYRVGIVCGMDESLEETEIYYWKSDGDIFGSRKLVPADHHALKHIIPSWSILGDLDTLPFRLLILYDSRIPSSHDLGMYASAIGTDLLVFQQVADNRKNRLPQQYYYFDGEADPYYYGNYFYLIPDGFLSRDIWDRALEDYQEKYADYYYDWKSIYCADFDAEEYRLYSPHDSALPTELPLPAFFLLSGIVEMEHDRDPDFVELPEVYPVFRSFENGYASYFMGLLYYRILLQNESITSRQTEQEAARIHTARETLQKIAGISLLYLYQSLFRRINP